MESHPENDTTHEETTDISRKSVIADARASETNGRANGKDNPVINKRRCVSTACIACRRRKSKCDGNLPKCAACASVYLTECEYAPHTDHRRKGVYKKEVDGSKTKNSTLHTLIQALLNYEEDDAGELLRQIRACDNLEELAQAVENKGKGIEVASPDSPIYGSETVDVPQFEAKLSGKMGDLVIDGAVRFIGGTSNLIWLSDHEALSAASPSADTYGRLRPKEEAILGWTTVTGDRDLILHFMNMYFCWHYPYFTALSKELFYRDFLTGTNSHYCSPLLVNVMLALGCHFSSQSNARANPDDSSTTGDHFFAEAERLLHDADEFANPKMCTVQALALMSVREAGCGRESKGWVYSGMSFRMASDLGLNVDVDPDGSSTKLSDEEIDARRITYWGCFLFDKCWSNYLGRQPQLLLTNTNVKKPDVFASEEAEMWSPYIDTGLVSSQSQPARTRAVALQVFKLGEISSDLLSAFYQPQNLDKPISKQAELKKLTDIHTRLEAWKTELPAEFEPKDWQLPPVLLMHMFYQLLYIHLYRPFLRYTKSTSPLPSHISPRKFCTQAAGAISKLFRLYKRTHGLRQICNIAVYIAHSACTIHLLNLPEKNAKRDIVHGIKHLEEIGECWTCARRTLRVLHQCAEQWHVQLPEEARSTLARVENRWGASASSPAPMSPNTLDRLANHMQAQPLTESTTGSLQRQVQMIHPPDPGQAVLQSKQAAQNQRILPHLQHSTPPRNMAMAQRSTELQKHAGQLRALTELTEAQQETWNAHQARMASQQLRPSFVSRNSAKNAATLFGGIDSLIEESQDWWLNDQSQIAVGFDNWNPPATEWSQVHSTMDVPMTKDSGLPPSTGSTPYYPPDVTQTKYGVMPTNGQPLYRMPDVSSQAQQPQRLPQPRQQHPINPHQMQNGMSDAADQNPRKRANMFEDGNAFF